MTHKKTSLFIFLLLAFSFVACKKGPKVIATPVGAEGNSSSTGIFSETKEASNPGIAPANASELHTVKVLEVLPTDKYVYLRVTEKDDEFWIATGKKEVEVGQSYFYKNGILKTNFESKEYNRVFDKVVLVANIVPVNHGGNETTTSVDSGQSKKVSDIKRVVVDGSIPIAKIVDNPKKFKGQTIQLSGVCTKVNPNIMGRNWIHLKDGSQDDFDLVITSDAMIPEGHQVTMTGTVVLEKDFGAGYKYDIIIENGEIVKTN